MTASPQQCPNDGKSDHRQHGEGGTPADPVKSHLPNPFTESVEPSLTDTATAGESASVPSPAVAFPIGAPVPRAPVAAAAARSIEAAPAAVTNFPEIPEFLQRRKA